MLMQEMTLQHLLLMTRTVRYAGLCAGTNFHLLLLSRAAGSALGPAGSTVKLQLRQPTDAGGL